MTFTRTTDSPFEDSSVLAEDYIPDEVLGRDQELDQISEVLQQIIDNEEPVNAFIYGISGTGKTVSIKYKQRELEGALGRYDDVHATFVYQNCESLSSSYQAAIAIANSFLEDPKHGYLHDNEDTEYGYLHDKINLNRRRLPSSGLPKERVYDIFFDILDHLTYRHTTYRNELHTALEDSTIADNVTASSLIEAQTSSTETNSKKVDILDTLHEEYDIQPPAAVTDYVTVVLDEVDSIGTKDELLYEIPRSRTNGRVENILPSVIGISNDIGYKESIQSKTDSSLRLMEITFKKYNVGELKEILGQRAESAFKEDAYVEEIIPLAAAYARRQGGDARYGIDLLQKAGMKAKKEGASVVTEDHITQAHEEKERDRVYEVTNDLSDQEKIVLAAVMYHDLRGDTPISRNDMYPTYKRYSESHLPRSNGSRRVGDYLKKMSQLGLLGRRDAYEGPGESGFEYSLDKLDYNMIIKVLSGSMPNGDSSDLLPNELVEAFEQLAQSDGEIEQAHFDSFD